MSREENIEVIQCLYGLNIEDVKAVLEEIGFDALSDRAIEILAKHQQDRESRYAIKFNVD